MSRVPVSSTVCVSTIRAIRGRLDDNRDSSHWNYYGALDILYSMYELKVIVTTDIGNSFDIDNMEKEGR